MKRVLIGFLLSPLLASIPFGVYALITYPIMLVITLIFAVPLFLILKRLRWLQWWHAFLAGGICAIFYILIDNYSSHSFDIDLIISSQNLSFIGLGASTGIVFWFIAIYRNSYFKFVKTRFPLAIILVLPIFAVGYIARDMLKISHTQGRVVEILKEPNPSSHSGRVLVRLTNGNTVYADLSDTWPRSMVEGRCFYLYHRWSTLRFHWVYDLLVPFGGGGDDC